MPGSEGERFLRQQLEILGPATATPVTPLVTAKS